MEKTIKHIHILGIAGTMTAPLARVLINQGHIVTGSDQDKIYPPISDLISDIPLNQPLKNIDLVIVGSSYKSFKICQDEFEQIKKQNIPYISATSYLAQNLIKKESILVAGSYGKTTISSLLAWLMPNSNYFFGGSAVDNFPSLHFSESEFSIIEADESINGLDTQAKFLYYRVKYLILTSANWEHKDSYKTREDNFNAFKELVTKIPKDGLLVYNPFDSEIQKLLPFCISPKLPYTNNAFESKLIGQHNQENINAAYTLCNYLNIPFDIQNFSGIKRRLETISNQNDILIIDDFAQSATRVKSALEAVRHTYPNRKITVYFEPHASFLQDKTSVAEFNQINSLCDEFILGKLKFSPDKNNRVTAKNWSNAIPDKIKYLPVNEDLTKHLHSTIQPHDILVHFSSGGLDGLNTLKKVYNNQV